MEAELEDLEEVEPSWELPADLMEYRCVLEGGAFWGYSVRLPTACVVFAWLFHVAGGCCSCAMP